MGAGVDAVPSELGPVVPDAVVEVLLFLQVSPAFSYLVEEW